MLANSLLVDVQNRELRAIEREGGYAAGCPVEVRGVRGRDCRVRAARPRRRSSRPAVRGSNDGGLTRNRSSRMYPASGSRKRFAASTAPPLPRKGERILGDTPRPPVWGCCPLHPRQTVPPLPARRKLAPATLSQRTITTRASYAFSVGVAHVDGDTTADEVDGRTAASPPNFEAVSERRSSSVDDNRG